MNIIWLGHAGFRIEIGGEVLLVDPWFTGSPVFPAERRAEAIEGVTAIFVTHGHGDHSADAMAVARELGVTVYGIPELMNWWAKREGIETQGFNKGGTVKVGDVAVTMVTATHSSSVDGPDGPIYMGTEAGYMISGEGKTIYMSGDTDVMADMAVFEALHKPDIGILCAGGHYTMDMRRASYAAKTFFNFKTVIPCHYRTFPLLEQSADLMKAELEGVDVIEPEIMGTITL